jgi:hypothetical protein
VTNDNLIGCPLLLMWNGNISDIPRVVTVDKKGKLKNNLNYINTRHQSTFFFSKAFPLEGLMASFV